jgi:hypothetical protein
MNLLVIGNVCFEVRDQLISCIRQILGKNWKYNETVHQLFIDFMKAYDFGEVGSIVQCSYSSESHEISKAD